MSKSIFRSSIVVSGSIFASRVFGLLRDVIIASSFGASSTTDAFFVAFRIPNLLRRIFAEGAFSSAFTPAFAKKLKASKREALKFAGEFLTVLLFSLSLTLLIGELLAPYVIKLVAPGLKGTSYLEAIKLLREMFPYILMVSLVAFFGGILNGFEHFFAPAFSTVLFNLAIIISALFLSGKMGVEALAVGVVAGGILQLTLQLIFLKKLKAIPKPLFSISEDVKKTLKNVIPGIFGFAVRQVSMLIDTILASFLKVGAISYLYYANRFVQLPLGMFAIGLSQVLLPRLSKKNSRKEFNRDLKAGITFCSAIVIPAAVGLIFFGKPIIDIVFNHGAFSEEALNETYKVLIGYSLGLFFFSAEKILTNAFYSLNEYKLPVKISAYTLIFNLLINLILCFGFHLGVMGLALGTSLTSALNVFALLYKFKNYDEKNDFWKLPLRYTLLSLPIAVTSLAGSKIYFGFNGFTVHLLTIMSVIIISALLYFAILLLTKDRVISLILEE